MLSLVGGKWTSWRAFSEEAADAVLKRLDVPRKQHTHEMAIGGGKEYPDDQQVWIAEVHRTTGVAADRVAVLFERYGTRARAAAEYISQGTDAPLLSVPDYTRREIEFLAKEEKVERLVDIVLRRTLIGMLGYADREALQELNLIVGDALGWSEQRRDEEMKYSMHILKQNFLSPSLLEGSP